MEDGGSRFGKARLVSLCGRATDPKKMPSNISSERFHHHLLRRCVTDVVDWELGGCKLVTSYLTSATAAWGTDGDLTCAMRLELGYCNGISIFLDLGLQY